MEEPVHTTEVRPVCVLQDGMALNVKLVYRLLVLCVALATSYWSFYAAIECQDGVCHNGGTCPSPGGNCTCPVGWTGSQCETGAPTS